MAKAKLIDAAHEERLLKAADSVTALVEGGMAPDDAVEKVAREGTFTRGDVETLGWSYNTGRQLRQFREGGGILDKLASFTLSDPAKVIAKIWGSAPEKVAHVTDAKAALDYLSPPTWLAEHSRLERVGELKAASAREKQASAANPTAPEPLSDDARCDMLRRATGVVQRNKQAGEELSRAASNAYDALLCKIADVTDYFRQARQDRLSFAETEAAVRTYIGPKAAKLMDLVYDATELGAKGKLDPKLAKYDEPRCPEKTPIIKRAVDQDSAPFSLIAASVKAAAAVFEARAVLVAHRTKAAQEDEEAMRPFVKAGASEPQGPAKAAGILGTPAVGAALGTMIGRTIGGVPQTKDDMIENAWMDLEDPQHQNELRKIKAHTMLTSMMTDPEDPISGHDPDRVLKAFNEVSQIAPRAAENSASVGPLIRRRLEGKTEPFEAKEMTDIEKGIAQSRATTPDTNILSATPSKLLA